MISYQISATTITTASPEQVFAVLDDFGHWPDWMPSFENIQVELPAEGSPQLGYRFELRSGLIRTHMQVIEHTPLSRGTQFRISFPPLTGTNCFRMAPLEDGRYRLERVDSLDLPEFVVNLIDSARRERFTLLAADFLRALKTVVERPPQ